MSGSVCSRGFWLFLLANATQIHTGTASQEKYFECVPGVCRWIPTTAPGMDEQSMARMPRTHGTTFWTTVALHAGGPSVQSASHGRPFFLEPSTVAGRPSTGFVQCHYR